MVGNVKVWVGVVSLLFGVAVCYHYAMMTMRAPSVKLVEKIVEKTVEVPVIPWRTPKITLRGLCSKHAEFKASCILGTDQCSVSTAKFSALFSSGGCKTEDGCAVDVYCFHPMRRADEALNWLGDGIEFLFGVVGRVACCIFLICTIIITVVVVFLHLIMYMIMLVGVGDMVQMFKTRQTDGMRWAPSVIYGWGFWSWHSISFRIFKGTVSVFAKRCGSENPNTEVLRGTLYVEEKPPLFPVLRNRYGALDLAKIVADGPAQKAWYDFRGFDIAFDGDCVHLARRGKIISFRRTAIEPEKPAAEPEKPSPTPAEPEKPAPVEAESVCTKE